MKMHDVLWGGFAAELEKVGGPIQLPDWYTDPISVTGRRLLSGQRGQGGIITPGGPHSTSGLPSGKGEDFSVSEGGTVFYAPSAPRKMREHKVPPAIERLRGDSPLKKIDPIIDAAKEKVVESLKPTEARADTP